MEQQTILKLMEKETILTTEEALAQSIEQQDQRQPENNEERRRFQETMRELLELKQGQQGQQEQLKPSDQKKELLKEDQRQPENDEKRRRFEATFRELLEIRQGQHESNEVTNQLLEFTKQLVATTEDTKADVTESKTILKNVHKDLKEGFEGVMNNLKKKCKLTTFDDLWSCIYNKIAALLKAIYLIYLCRYYLFHMPSYILYKTANMMIQFFGLFINIIELIFEGFTYDCIITYLTSNENAGPIFLDWMFRLIFTIVYTLTPNWFSNSTDIQKIFYLSFLKYLKKYKWLKGLSKIWTLSIIYSINGYRSISTAIHIITYGMAGERLELLKQEEIDELYDLDKEIEKLDNKFKEYENTSDNTDTSQFEEIDFEEVIKKDSIFQEFWDNYGGPKGKLKSADFPPGDSFGNWIEERENLRVLPNKIMQRVNPRLVPNINGRQLFIQQPPNMTPFALPQARVGLLPMKGGGRLTNEIINLPQRKFEFLEKMLKDNNLHEKKGGKRKYTLKKRVVKRITIKGLSKYNKKINKCTNKITRKRRCFVGGNPSENFDNALKLFGVENISEMFKKVTIDSFDEKFINKKIEKFEIIINSVKSVLRRFNYENRELTEIEKTIFKTVFKFIDSTILSSFGIMGFILNFIEKTIRQEEAEMKKKEQQELWEEVLNEELKKKKQN